MADKNTKTDTVDKKPTGLELMRVPFLPHQISKLPKQSKKQGDDVKSNPALGIRCNICGGWHHKDAVHLDYVGHAALTDRLLDCDPNWNWSPVAVGQTGAPMIDGNGGLWIYLTVCGVTRLGYGHPDGKSGGDAVKEAIGDALRNAAMRFGAALDLWHKGQLHLDEEPQEKPVKADMKADIKPAKTAEPQEPKADIVEFSQAEYEALNAKIKEAVTPLDIEGVKELARAAWPRIKQKSYKELITQAIGNREAELKGFE